ncbi:AsmA family protein [Snuella sedimenti]|uniref:AsmA family protein n=1 Tax=Snuella sedimenti TaxID=2798802 RepID=A0A8J7LTU1_9FLAO|nr:AsmA family protein [Snuella sedimenti]MBJ6369360.1 AsmA family protein [Snuella sedimenti]
MKKALKITGIALLIVIALLIALPLAFKSQIKDMVKRFINDNLNAHVEFSDVSLSFIKNFPQAHIGVDDLVITNFEPFKDEVFTSVKNIAFTMSVKELFKTADEGPLTINAIYINEAILNLKTDENGNVNYDITKPSEDTTSKSNENNFSFDIQDYKIINSSLNYSDASSKINMRITNLNHQGKGIFSANTSELDTSTEALVSFSMDSTNYLNNNSIKLNAIINLDLTNNKYTFKDNKGFINQLPIEFSGYVQLMENGQNIDISFENPESDFKNFLALIPENYSKNIENVETSGDFKVQGRIYGTILEDNIPKFSIKIASNNASFKYPDLPKRVENIFINTIIQNNSGQTDDTYINVNALNFQIDNDIFESRLSLKNITKNMLVNADINGTLNLGNITKVYPIELDTPLSGILKAKLNTVFDMKAIETNAYARIKNNGSLDISDFMFSSEDIVNPIHISQANMTFNPGTINLNNFRAKTGDSDLNVTGTIQNLLGFLLSDNTLQGNFKLTSDLFKVSDFMTESEETPKEKKTTTTETLKIPKFLDCTINASAKTVVYDNLNLKDVKGTLILKDQQATLKDMSSSIFNGKLAVNGIVSTQTETPSFQINLGADGFDISESFKGMALLQNLAPIAKLLEGKLNTNIGLSGNLDNEFTPQLNSLSGNAIAELLATKISPDQTALFSKLEGALNFVDFNKLDLKDLKTKFEFNNGQVSVKPFQVKFQDITIDISGSHGFDKKLNYNAVFNVPAKYLGNEVNQLIAKIDSEETKKINVPVTTNISGTLADPSVKTDLTSSITNLTKQLVVIQKQKLLNQGKDKVKNMLGDLIGNNQSKSDSLKKQQNNAIKDVVSGIFNNRQPKVDSASVNKPKMDSTNTNANQTKETVKNVLGGLFGNKKTKDTIN